MDRAAMFNNSSSCNETLEGHKFLIGQNKSSQLSLRTFLFHDICRKQVCVVV